MIQSVVVLLWLVGCAVQDMHHRQISNLLTLGVGLLALIYLLLAGSTWLGASVEEGGWAFALALLLGLPGYVLGRFGAGDVKLLAALALASSVDHVLWSLIGAALCLAARQLMRQGFSAGDERSTVQASTQQPFAPYVFTGFALSCFWIH